MSEKFDPQKKYIQMHSMELSADKIARYLDEIKSSNPHMYSKTKVRYFNLASNLLDCVNKIGCLIEEDQLISISSSNLSSPDFKVIQPVQLNTSIEHVYSDYKHTEDKFREVLKDSSETDFKYDEVNQCAKLLYRWFDTRFPNLPTSFRYKVEWFPELIGNFILTFGKYMHENRLADFYHEVELWCDKLNPTQTYTVPYCVFNITKSKDPEDYTLEAVMANDLLVDRKLYMLSDYEFSEGCACYDGNYLAQKVRNMNPKLIPKLRYRIAKQDELLEELNFTQSDVVA